MKEVLTSDLHQEDWDNLHRLFSSIISAWDDYEARNDTAYEDDEIYVLYSQMHKESLVSDLGFYADSIMNNLANKETANLKADFDSVVSICDELDIHLEEEFEEIERTWIP